MKKKYVEFDAKSGIIILPIERIRLIIWDTADGVGRVQLDDAGWYEISQATFIRLKAQLKKLIIFREE